MSKKDALYWIERADNVPVHYFHTDEEITIEEICSTYEGSPQVHVFVASKYRGDKNNTLRTPF